MSLKNFHIVFISVSLLVTIGFGLWAFQEYRQSRELEDLLLGITALLMLVALACYGRWFWRKLGRMPEPAVLIATLGLSLYQLAPRSVEACSVCFKNPDSELVKGAQAGVLFLAIVIYALLTGMLVLVYTWYRRSRSLPS